MSIGAPDNHERRLLAEYGTATRFYSWAVSELSRQRGVLPLDAYDKLRELVENARRDCDKARLALQGFRSGKRNSK
jgi:hypothetical protein